MSLMKPGRILLVILGATVGALLVVWWFNDRRIPTLQLSHTIGKGNSVSLDWIELK
jgi:hypothetical protein